MGGKVWSEDEERVFWTEIIPNSNKRHLLAKPHTDDAKGWDVLRHEMQRIMGRRARRKYTSLMLYEHFFQNSVLERFSPNAKQFVREYINNERNTTGQAPSQRSRSTMRFAQRGSGSGRRRRVFVRGENQNNNQGQSENHSPLRQSQVHDCECETQQTQIPQNNMCNTTSGGVVVHESNNIMLPPLHSIPALSAPLESAFPPLPVIPSYGSEASALCEPDCDLVCPPNDDYAPYTCRPLTQVNGYSIVKHEPGITAPLT